MLKRPRFLYDVFISYAHPDRTWIRRSLLPRLEAAGLSVCIDERDFEIGIPSLINIERAVDNSKYILMILTPAWVESAWTEFESVLVASKDPAARQRRLLPLKLLPCEPPSRIAALTYADFTQRRSRARAFSRLLEQIQPVPKSGARTGKITPADSRRRSRQTLPSSTEGPFSTEPSTFVVGLPVIHPRHFFGHERVVSRLFNLLKRYPLQNAAIIGPRRSGKTSLLLYLRNLTTVTATAPEQLRPDQRSDWLPRPERYRWIFVDFQDPRLGSKAGLLRYFLSNLSLPAPEPCDLEGFLDIVSRHLRTPTVVLLDEIDVALQRYPELDNSFWESLRSLASTQVEGNLSFVLAATESPGQLARHSGVGSPFFNIFGYTVTLGPLTELEARALIASSPILFSPADTEWILAQSNRWPILLQILCRECLFALEDGAVDETWREEGLRQIEPFCHLLGS